MPGSGTNAVDTISDIVEGQTAPSKAVITDANQHVDHVVQAVEMTFTEDGKTTYTADVTIPANSWIIDIQVHAVALWDDGSSASLIVGDVGDPDGYFTAVDLKATDLLAGEGVGRGLTGGTEGADWGGGEAAGDHFDRNFLSTTRVFSGVVTTGAQDGTTGRTRVLIVYITPSTVRTVAATGV